MGRLAVPAATRLRRPSVRPCAASPDASAGEAGRGAVLGRSDPLRSAAICGESPPDGSQNRRRSRGVVQSAFLVMVIARLAALAAGVVAFAVTGRLLEPQEFGHFAVALAAWTLLSAVSEFGLRSFLIRERDLEPEDPGRALGLALALPVRSRIPAPRARPDAPRARADL